MNKNQYESVYKNSGTTPRTTAEASKNVDYATPIYRMNTELDDAKEFVIGLVVCVLLMFCFVAIGYGFMVWLDISL